MNIKKNIFYLYEWQKVMAERGLMVAKRLNRASKKIRWSFKRPNDLFKRLNGRSKDQLGLFKR